MSGGAQLNVGVAPRERTLKRRPPHVGYLKGEAIQAFTPWMAAPVRPGEVIRGVHVHGETMTRQILNIQQSPLCFAELGVWLVPLSTLDPFFINLIMGTSWDVAQSTPTGGTQGSAAQYAGNPTTDQGHTTPGLQAAVRNWAGEVGGVSGGTNGVAGTYYAPYVSWATYKVVDDWYQMAQGQTQYQDKNMFDSAPTLRGFIEGALTSNFDVSLGGVDADPSAATSLASLIEDMFILTSSEMSYAEYLAAHSINPRRGSVGGLSQPLVLQNQMMRHREGDIVAGYAAVDTNRGTAESDDTTQSEDLSAFTGLSVVHDRAEYSSLRSSWSTRNPRPVLVEEPSIVLGTHVWWAARPKDDEYCYMFDMTRMTHPGHWGNRSFGGVEEEDFIAAQQLYDSTGTALQAGANDNQSGDAVFNMLNLYVNGEICCPNQGGEDEFQFREIGGDPVAGNNATVNGKFLCRLDIESDLVA